MKYLKRSRTQYEKVLTDSDTVRYARKSTNCELNPAEHALGLTDPDTIFFKKFFVYGVVLLTNFDFTSASTRNICKLAAMRGEIEKKKSSRSVRPGACILVVGAVG